VRIAPIRLHVRGMVRDGKEAFLGSMSMRRLELGARREIGVFFRDPKCVKQMAGVFESDWAASSPALSGDLLAAALDKPAKKVAKVVAKKIAVKPVVEELLDRIMDSSKDMPFEPEEVAETVREAFREEVHDAVVNALREVVIGVQEADATGEPVSEEEKHQRAAALPEPRTKR